jgi:zona occludens toxin (predicted ATPase)
MAMGFDELNELERKLYEYIKAGDFENRKWNSKEAARHFDVELDKVYGSLSNLSKKIRDNIYIHYRDSGLRISAE